MNSELLTIANDMRELGLAALAHANRHSAYYDPCNPEWHKLSVLQAAHAAEVLIKARIAEEHPLLIFEKFPKISSIDISLSQLFNAGKTIDWSDLPTRLWATTGIKLANLDQFKEFGMLRNGIQHFGATPNKDELGLKTLQFIFSVIDPFINDCWGLYAVNYDEDDDSFEHFPLALLENQIMFLVPNALKDYKYYWNLNWDSLSEPYKTIMRNRIDK